MNSTLLLNSDGAPVSLLPLSTISWKEAVSYLIANKAVALEYYHDWIIHSQRWSTPVPAVMMLKDYQKKKLTVRYSKNNVFLRDEFKCQYCGISVDKNKATLDHILPLSHGGKSSWENTTTACSPCNSRKGNKKDITPKTKPYKPNYYQLVDKRRRLGFIGNNNELWKPYLEF